MRIIEFRHEEDGFIATGYLHHVGEGQTARRVRPCVVVCPGGGYVNLADHENEPVAMAYFAAGYQVFVLAYSRGEDAAGLRPLMEISRLVMRLRAQADAWQIAPDKIAVMGFSAGGHLAASLGVLWNAPLLREKLDTRGGMNRPDAMVLAYPVISAGLHRHSGSIALVTGGDPALTALFSLETQVGGETAPTFIWHTADDASVPVENALLLCQALSAHKVPFEAHIFETGPHGLSLAIAETLRSYPRVMPWFDLCLAWLSARFDFPR